MALGVYPSRFTSHGDIGYYRRVYDVLMMSSTGLLHWNKNYCGLMWYIRNNKWFHMTVCYWQEQNIIWIISIWTRHWRVTLVYIKETLDEAWILVVLTMLGRLVEIIFHYLVVDGNYSKLPGGAVRCWKEKVYTRTGKYSSLGNLAENQNPTVSHLWYPFFYAYNGLQVTLTGQEEDWDSSGL